MPAIEAFHGLRYDLGHVGALSDVVAPPYDVIDSELQDALYKKHPCNVIRLILNREEPGDDEKSNRYSRAARLLKNWREEGVLQSEHQATLYVYHQVFQNEGAEHTRQGFMCRMRLTRFGEGNIYPHEETHSAAKADRLRLTRACKTNVSQIFGIYPDEENEAQNILESAIAGVAPLEATDHLGVSHRLWPVSDIGIIHQVQAILDDKPMYVADGHHRYETACNYRDELVSADGPLPPQHPANFVLTMCVGMSDPGMLVLPTHRLFRGMRAITSDELITKLGDCFDCRIAGEGVDLAEMIWEEIAVEDSQTTLGLFTAQDERWVVARLTDAGRDRLAQIAGEQSTDWRGLGVSILHRLLVDTLLASGELPRPKYVHSVSEVIEGLESGDKVGRDATGQEGQGGRFELAALVMPATLEHIRLISEEGERMPAKSTYFYPKLLCGLVLNPLE